MADEKVFLNEAGITVTQARFVVPAQTFAMSGVTSVLALKSDPKRTGPIVLGVLGLITLMAGKMGILVALLLIAGAVAWWMALKTTYIVKLRTSGGESNAYSSKDKELVDRIISALNESIIARG
jgi:hypothetical protein